MSSLTELCQIALIRNHRSLVSLMNIPYRLAKPFLSKMRPDALAKLETTNIWYIFEDDELWLRHLQQDFPTNVHEVYVRDLNKIKQYFLDFVREHDPDIFRNNPELLEYTLKPKLKRNIERQKFLVPYRLLYHKYQADVTRKQEQSAVRLRQQVAELEQKRAAKQTVVIEALETDRKRAPRRSELFKKSIKGHESRLLHFKTGGFDIAKRHASVTPARIQSEMKAGKGSLTLSEPPKISREGSASKTNENILLEQAIESMPNNQQEFDSRSEINTKNSTPPSPVKKRSRRQSSPSIFLKKKKLETLPSRSRLDRVKRVKPG